MIFEESFLEVSLFAYIDPQSRTNIDISAIEEQFDTFVKDTQKYGKEYRWYRWRTSDTSSHLYT